MEFTKEKHTFTIYFEGRIDSGNAPELEKEINAIGFERTDSLVLDMQKLEYISSAGLRVILRLKKSNSATKIINASSDVYEIFDMTGFTEMMDISKAYREMSVEGCEIIGEGANGLVYRIDNDTVIKVYKNPDSLDEIRNERELARKAFVMGVPSAIPYDVVKVGDLYGSVFELLEAESFAKLVNKDPDSIEELAAQSVEILKTIHAILLQKGTLPDKKQEALSWVERCRPYLDSTAYEKLNKMMSEIPDSDTMLHGDYHVKNIMRQHGENLLIDMDTLAQGHPIFEFTAIFLAYLGFLGIKYEYAERFWNATLKSYFADKDEAFIEEVKRKAALIGYTRLLRRSAEKIGLDTEMGKKLVEYCRNYIQTNIDKVDSLYY